ncbi:MAG: 3-oxoacyl-[acyl-carrier-protein] reductase [Eubacteriales bacterium]|nr:3-oxoacyl-[acyl-carrier-protein] reductase [Eubacteriales bacterium]
MLVGKVALVTGAGKGIGRAIALALAKEGAVVAVNYQSSREAALETLRLIQEKQGTGEIICCDVSDHEAVRSMVDGLIARYGRLDILVNNAGVARDGLLARMTQEDFSKVIETNLMGTFYTIRYTARQMVRQKEGRIINITSVTGITGNAGQANYAASKAGIIGLTKTAAKELARKGITVNAVAPGFIRTDMAAAVPEQILTKAINTVPMGRIGEPEEVADLVAYLASEKAAYITGQVICIDGGMI